MKKHALLLAAALVVAQPVFAATNPWFGTWKLNRAKSTFTGSTYTITKVNGKYHFDYGAVKFDIADDGKDYPIIANRTGSLKPTGKNEWLEVIKVDGKETSRTEIKISDDQKSVSFKETGTHADGSTFKSEYTDERLSGGPGIAGTWKNLKESSSSTTTQVWSDAGAGKVKVEYPSSQASMVMTFDGKPVVESGPRAVAGETSTYKQVSPMEVQYTILEKGQKYVEGVETVSADGKVLKDVSWLVTKPAEKRIEIYEKQ